MNRQPHANIDNMILWQDGALPTDADNKQQLCLRTDIEPTLQTGLTLKLHQLLVLLTTPTLAYAIE